MKVIEYIKEHDLQALNENLGIQIKEYDDLVLLDYSQIDSPKSHPVVMECRGLILEKDTWRVVCRSFDRFFNYGECPEHSSFDFDKATFVEKADGSLIRVYWYNGQWEIATRGTAFAQSAVSGTGMSFRDLFLRALDITEEEFQAHCSQWMQRDTTYIFELSCDENRVVVGYGGDTVTALGYRHNKSGEADFVESCYTGGYVNYYWLLYDFQRVRIPKYYHFDSMDKVLGYVENIERHEGAIKEGFVVYVDGHPVCKMKSPLYVKVHYLRTNAKTFKVGAELVLSNETAEYLAYFPQDKEWLNEIDVYVETRLRDAGEYLDAIYKNVLGVQMSQKDFAMYAVKHPASALLFSARKNESTPRKEFFKLPIDKQVSAIVKWYSNEKEDQRDN